MKGYMYILECADGSYYTGSTTDLELRLQQHQSGEGANHTRKRLPVRLVYYEEFERIDEAFYREKQVQGWSRRKKEALMENRANDYVPSTGSGTESNTLIGRSRNHRWRNKNVPSTGSGIGSSNNKSFLQILENLLFLS